MNERQKEIIIGSLLGDCSLQTFTNGHSWRARFIQGDKNKEYLFHLYSEFKSLVGTPPKSISDGKGNIRWYFNTKVLDHENGKELGDLFYVKKGGKWKKRVNKNLKYLSPLSMAYWYMDDGNLKKVKNTRSYRICTDSFSLLELKQLSLIFREYGIEISYHKQRPGQYRIYIPTKYKEVWKDLIKDHIIEEMKYKIHK